MALGLPVAEDEHDDRELDRFVPAKIRTGSELGYVLTHRAFLITTLCPALGAAVAAAGRVCGRGLGSGIRATQSLCQMVLADHGQANASSLTTLESPGESWICYANPLCGGPVSCVSR